MSDVGLGQLLPQCAIRIFIANRPPLDFYQQMDDCLPMVKGEIAEIAQSTGNHWRKIFNVYAKLMFGLLLSNKELPCHIKTWQLYRDQVLLQKNSHTALIFSKPNLAIGQDTSGGLSEVNTINIIMGKQYGASLGFDRDKSVDLNIINNDFAIVESKRLIICPYFDYRQLSNIKIEHLVLLIQQLQGLK